MDGVFIGTSGWQYPHFKDRFYPADVPSAAQLSYFSERLGAVEINRSFYNFTRRPTYEKWARETPEGFRVAMKAHRSFTHDHPLEDAEGRLAELYENMAGLGSRCGPLLFQTPPSLKFDLPLLRGFLSLLNPEYRHAFELRDRSWAREETYDLLRSFGIAWCIADLRGVTAPLEVTSDFVYVRLHGPEKQPYRGSYAVTLPIWAARVQAWRASGLGVYVFFDNTMRGDAIDDARELQRLVGIERTADNRQLTTDI